MLSIKKDHRVNYITLLFLAVFVLLRVGQYYCQAPIFNQRNDTHQTGTKDISLHAQPMNILRVLDRYILEVKDDTAVPKIKFSGTVLYLAFVALSTTLLFYRKIFVDKVFFSPDKHPCALLCVFRL